MPRRAIEPHQRRGRALEILVREFVNGCPSPRCSGRVSVDVGSIDEMKKVAESKAHEKPDSDEEVYCEACRLLASIVLLLREGVDVHAA